MNQPVIAIVAIVLVAVVMPLLAGERTPSAQANAPAQIEDFVWLTGSWVGEGLGGLLEETWSPPRGGMMLGSFRLIKDDEVSFMEIITLSEHDGQIQMRVKHFHPDLVGWEERADFVTFHLRNLTPEQADFNSLVIHRVDDDHLRMDLRMRSGDQVRIEPMHFTRQSLTP